MSGPGSVDGYHYTKKVEQVKELKRQGKLDDAERLLSRVIDAVEAEAKANPGWGVAPWYYEQLAIVYSKQKNLDAELAILERFARQAHAPGARTPKLLERLERARAKLEKQRQASRG